MANIWNPTPARILQGLLSDQINERESHEASIRHAQIDIKSCNMRIKSCNMRIDALSQAIRALGETPDITAYHGGLLFKCAGGTIAGASQSHDADTL